MDGFTASRKPMPCSLPKCIFHGNTMLFLERLAEQKIQEAQSRGEFDNFSGAGTPLPEEDGIVGVAPSLRMAYRILKNAGYVPEEVRLRREISEVRQLLQQGFNDEQQSSQVRRRLLMLTERLGHLRGGNLMLADRYLTQVVERLDCQGAKKDPPAGGSVASSARKEVER